MNRKLYLIVSVFGLITMALGQLMTKPQFYGTVFGRAWAHVFWLGFLLFILPLVILFTRYVAHHKNPLVVKAGKYELMGLASITCVVGFITIGAMLTGNDALTRHDGDARRGVFVIWLLLIIVFTAANLFTLLIKQLKQAKRL